MAKPDQAHRPRHQAKIKHAVIAAHPETLSFTMAMARRYCAEVARQGQQPVLRDLYRIGFDPVLKADERVRKVGARPRADVAMELDLLADAAVIVLVYPIWFGTPPAIIKGYVERVLGAGADLKTMTRHLGQSSSSWLAGKRLASFTCSGASQSWLSDQGAWTSLQTIFDGYIARAFWMDTPGHIHFDEIGDGLDPTLAAAHLIAVEDTAARFCRELASEKVATPAPSPS